MSKIHIILIFGIAFLVSISFWLLTDKKIVDTAPEKVTSKKKVSTDFSDSRENRNVPKVEDYVQGPLKLPDLEQDFQRCLNRGYNDLQKEVLRDAKSAFESKRFDEGSFTLNNVIYVDEFGDSIRNLLNANMLLTIFKKVEGKFVEVERIESFSLEKLNAKLVDKKIILNEYTQKFTKGDLEMDLTLEHGRMKSLIIKSPKKRVVCKP